MPQSLAIPSQSVLHGAAFSDATCSLPVAKLTGAGRTIELMNPFNLVGSVRTSTAKPARAAENDKASIAAFVENRAGQTQNI